MMNQFEKSSPPTNRPTTGMLPGYSEGLLDFTNYQKTQIAIIKSRFIMRAALDQLVSGASEKEPIAQLSAREREVLALIAEGLSNKQVAQRLGIGVRTVETYRQRIMDRLEIHSVAGLTRFAIAHGIISLESNRSSH